MNPYATPAQVTGSVSRSPRNRVGRYVAWITLSAIAVAFLVYPAEPRLIPIREAIGVGIWIVPFLPFILYEVLCRSAPTSLSLAAAAGLVVRCFLTYVLPYLISQFCLIQFYNYVVPFLFGPQGLILTSSRLFVALAFVIAAMTTMLYDLYAARRVSTIEASSTSVLATPSHRESRTR